MRDMGYLKPKAIDLQRKSCIRTMAYFWLTPKIQNEQSGFVSPAPTSQDPFLTLHLPLSDERAF